MFFRKAYSASEIKCGLVMFVSPATIAVDEELAAAGDAVHWWTMLGNHYVLVVEVDNDLAAVTPLSSHPCGPNWVPVEGKVGHPSSWVEPPTFFDPRQVWPVSKRVLIDAARIGRDQSEAGRR